MNYDEVLLHLGKFGSYQKRNYILLCLPIILCAFHKLSGVFILAEPDHRCKLDGESFTSSFVLPESVLNSSYPFDKTAKKFSQCEYFTDKKSRNESTHELEKCSDYVWDTTKYESSAVKSFLMICDRGDLKPRSDALLMVGVFMGIYLLIQFNILFVDTFLRKTLLLGSFAFGHLSDKFGRRKVFVLSLAFQLLFGLLIAVSPDFLYYTISRMVIRTWYIKYVGVT